MIFKCINILMVGALSLSVIGCSSSSSSSGTAATGTSVVMSAAPSPATAVAMVAGAKTFANDMADSITLTKAYLVISSTTIETTCGVSFSAALEGMIDVLIPSAIAHTEATPTSTGTPYVINLLAADNVATSIGSMSPSVADYCGVDVDMFVADADANGLPTDVDMVGKTLYIEGAYKLSVANGGGEGVIKIDTGASLINRNLLLSALMMISVSSPNAAVTLAINYDTWFDAVDLAALETETVTSTDPNVGQASQLVQNITSSIHQM